jgi:hypothetical protein
MHTFPNIVKAFRFDNVAYNQATNQGLSALLEVLQPKG